MRPDSPQPPLGLRERKKQQTKQALEQAAFSLFAAQGYAETTVEDIASAAQVSRASFFRYFGSKEDVLAADDNSRRERFVAALARQPRQAPVLAAIKAALTEYLASVRADERNCTYIKVILGSRVLLGRACEIRMRWQHDLETELRARLDGVSNADIVAAMLATVVLAVLETSLRLVTFEQKRDVTDILDIGFGLLTADLVS
ncbi:MAG TPA: helix-turn-helix domain-containing protein [Pseudonocardiaceae bacterium]|nr:helix-turn-helix domain-containing protein [Pseudonocardiaceae bacterium]